MDYRNYIARCDRRPAIVAHRGAWRTAPENSLAAIRAAIDGGCEIVEIDVRRSADGELFLMHDDTLERMTGNTEPPESLTMAALGSLHLRDRDGGALAALSDETVPTLAAALETGKGKVFFDLDVKHMDMLESTAALVAELGMERQVDVKTKVRSVEEAEALLALQHRHGVMVMPMSRFRGDTAEAISDILLAIRPAMVESKFDTIETLARAATRLRDGGIAVWVNTLDPVACCDLTDSRALEEPETVWGTLLDAGVSILQTDEPEALSAFLATRSGKA